MRTARETFREAVLAGLICVPLAGLALLHNLGKRTTASSQPAERPLAGVARATAPSHRPHVDLSSPTTGSAANLDSLAQLRLAVTDSDTNVRLLAIAELANIDDERAGEILATTAAYDHADVVREEAINALSEQRGAADLQALEQALRDPSRRVREAAIEAFVTIGSEAAARSLGAFVHASDVSLRLQVVDALGAIEGEIAAASLRDALTDENEVVREAATELLVSDQGAEHGQ